MEILENKKILVVAPHPDDESIGAGGLLALKGSLCDVLLLTDGRHGHSDQKTNESELTKTRLEEINSACSLAKVNKVFNLNIEDLHLYEQRRKVYDFDLSNYTYILVPNRFEDHVDHMAVYPIFKQMIKSQKLRNKVQLVQYEVWTPIRFPNCYVNISSVVNAKKGMIQQHVTQMAECDFATRALSLNAYRGMFCNADYAEAFFFEDESIKGKLKKLIPANVKLLLKQQKQK